MTRCLIAILTVGITAASAQRSDLIANARLHPDSFDANHAAGEYLVARKEIADAIPFLERAREIAPHNYGNGFDLALAYFSNGDLDKSRNLIGKLLEDHQNGELHNLLGDVAEAQGNFNEAAREYEAAARLDPSEKDLFDLGSDLLKHRDFPPALKVFEFGTGRYPKSPQLRVGLGIANYSVGQYDDAVDNLCRAVDLAPNDTRALEFLGKMNGISERYSAEVSSRLAHFAAVYPRSAPANFYYGVSLLDRPGTGSTAMSRAKARPYLERAINLQSGYGEAHFVLGMLFEDDAKDSDAVREYKAAILYGAELPKAHYRLARLYQKTGQIELAHKEFAEVSAAKAGDEHK